MVVLRPSLAGRIRLCGYALAAILGTAANASCDAGTQTLTVYNGQHPQLTQALATAFERKTGIAVNLRSNDSIVLTQQLLQEGSASPADVVIAENSPELMLLEQHDLLQQLPAATLSSMPARVSSPSGHWVGMAARVSCLVYNPRLISSNQVPRTILDLSASQWAGKVGIAPADSDFVPVVAAVVASRGGGVARQWLTGLKHNAVISQDIEGVLASVNHGDMPLGVINSYYWYRLQSEVGGEAMQSRIAYFERGDPGGIENIAGLGIVRSTQHRALAQQFVDFVVSAQGQQILASGDDFEYPLRPDVSPNRVLPPLATVDPTIIDIAALGDDQAAARLLQQAGLT